MRRVCSAAVFLPVAVALCGCGGGPKVVPVSGRVTMNGNPLPNAVVVFQPMASSRGTDPGPGSVGVTDADGRFTLYSQLDKSQPGAVVGKHRVRISPTEGGPAGDADATNPTKQKQAGGKKIPVRYNVESDLTQDVPEGGTNSANFELKAP